jgi:magnesium transporter
MHITKGKADWIDFLNPSEEDLAWLKSHFHFEDFIIEELRKPSPRSKVEAYDNFLFFTFYLPIFDEREQTSHRAEIDFILTRHQVISVHYEKIQPLNEAQVDGAQNSLELVHNIISSLLVFEERQLHHIQEKLEDVGARIFKHQNKQILEKISRLKRDISEYRIVIRHQEPVLTSLHLRGVEFWGPEARVLLDDLLGVNQKIVGLIENFRETINDFEDTHSQLMNLRINTAMKTFTILSFLTFPFVLFAAVYSLPVQDNPFVHMPNAFWIAVGIIVVGVISLLIYFQSKKWL